MCDDRSMKALTGTYAERTQATLNSGCDRVLHCNGVMAEMAEIAAHTPALEGASLRRATSAARALPLTQTPSTTELQEWGKLTA